MVKPYKGFLLQRQTFAVTMTMDKKKNLLLWEGVRELNKEDPGNIRCTKGESPDVRLTDQKEIADAAGYLTGLQARLLHKGRTQICRLMPQSFIESKKIK